MPMYLLNVIRILLKGPFRDGAVFVTYKKQAYLYNFVKLMLRVSYA